MAKYRISQERYEELSNAQGGVCAICERHCEVRRLAIDHSHHTGKVRGLLCHKCNTALGLFKDDSEIIQAALNYLEKHK